jgi:hypothetical protein
MSRMGPATPEEIEGIVQKSPLHAEYATAVDRESAREELEGAASPGPRAAGTGASKEPRGAASNEDDDEEPTLGEKLGKALESPAGKTLQRELVRGLFGVLGLRTAVRRRRRRSIF